MSTDKQPTIGDKVAYRAQAGDQYEAEVMSIHPGGAYVDIDVIVPGTDKRVPLRAVRWGAGGPAGWPDSGAAT